MSSRFAGHRVRLSAALLSLLVCAFIAGCSSDEPSAVPSAGPTSPPAGPAVTASYGVGGTVSGLVGAGLVLQSNNGDDLAINADGQFEFPASVTDGASYAVAVKNQPVSPSQTCSVSSGSGVVAGSKVANVAVACSVNAYAVGGTVTGLTGTALVLQNNGTDDLLLNANGSFSFPTKVASGASFSVTIKTPPRAPLQNCTVSTGSGQIVSTDVQNVAIKCVPITLRTFYMVGSTTDSLSALNVDLVTPGLSAVPGSPVQTLDKNYNVAVHPSGKFVYTTMYSLNTIEAFAVDASTGQLLQTGIAQPTGNYPAWVAVDPSGRYVVVSNFYESSISMYAVNPSTGALTQVSGSPFATSAAPYQLAFDSQGKYLYVAGSRDNNITVFALNPTAATLTPIVGSPFAAGAASAYIEFTPSGRFAYVTNWYGDSISMFAVDSVTGALTNIGAISTGLGSGPRMAVVSPNGRFLFVIGSDSATLYAYGIDDNTGQLTALGQLAVESAYPFGLVADPASNRLYVSYYSNYAMVSAITYDEATGSLLSRTDMTTPGGSPGGSFIALYAR